MPFSIITFGSVWAGATLTLNNARQGRREELQEQGGIRSVIE
ncbi:hypothetical protein ACINK0_18255 (plasmid) [Deinococcus sp. VB343]|uniref:Uncharacterized protein n=1 Tax=Deinococcus sp. VB142 TaxID=3112952 RepID=A0AAU6Q8Q6_9DEIO